MHRRRHHEHMAFPTENVPAALVVDDEPAVRQLVARMLEGQGYRVVCAEGEEEVMQVAARERQLALAVIDMRLRNHSGVEVLGAVRVAHPGVRVLFTSGDPDALERVRNAESTKTAVLPKPFTAAELANAVARLLAAQPRPSGSQDPERP
jgi:two-component system, cell cycle sensor histidine kinase and response regulator CckA